MGTAEIRTRKETNTCQGREVPGRPTPTSVKKPAIPAWQEPCSSPYFFLYSGGGGKDREQTTAASVCAGRVRGGRALAASPSAAVGWALGHCPDCGAEGKSQESTRPQKSRLRCHQVVRLPSAPQRTSYEHVEKEQ